MSQSKAVPGLLGNQADFPMQNVLQMNDEAYQRFDKRKFVRDWRYFDSED